MVRNASSFPVLLLAVALLVSCGTRHGEFEALTYNVAGLPEPFSKSLPATYTPLMSPLLNAYDLVLVQEDFAYHSWLAADANHPYQSERKQPEYKLFADGLNRFSEFRVDALQRDEWATCSGTLTSGSGADCGAEKGFSVATTWIEEEIEVDVYNLHMDAGGDPEDYDARSAQVEQLLAVINDRSAGRALIVAGDTNLKLARAVDDAGLFDHFIEEAGLTVACRAVECGDERHDRIMYRSSAAVEIEATAWKVDRRFVTDAGVDLSDHEAIAVTLSWRQRD